MEAADEFGEMAEVALKKGQLRPRSQTPTECSQRATCGLASWSGRADTILFR
jgi:hypothetical protein